MADRDGLIWFNGEMGPLRDANIHVLAHTLHRGVGVFEGVRTYQTESCGTCIFRLNETQRLTVHENNLSEAYIRPLILLASEDMGLRAAGLKVRARLRHGANLLIWCPKRANSASMYPPPRTLAITSIFR